MWEKRPWFTFSGQHISAFIILIFFVEFALVDYQVIIFGEEIYQKTQGKYIKYNPGNICLDLFVTLPVP